MFQTELFITLRLYIYLIPLQLVLSKKQHCFRARYLLVLSCCFCIFCDCPPINLTSSTPSRQENAVTQIFVHFSVCISITS